MRSVRKRIAYFDRECIKNVFISCPQSSPKVYNCIIFVDESIVESVRVCRFRYTGKALGYGRSKRLSGLISPSSDKGFHFRKKRKKLLGTRSVEYRRCGKTVTCSFYIK